MNDRSKEAAKAIARICAEMVSERENDNDIETSETFVSLWNGAIKIVTPLEFCRMICDELTKDKKS